MSSGYEGILQHKGIKPELVGKLGKCGHMYHLLCLVAMYNNGNKVGKSLWARRCYDVTLGSNYKLVMSNWIAWHWQMIRLQYCCTQMGILCSLIRSVISVLTARLCKIMMNSAHFSSVSLHEIQMYCLLMQKRQLQADLINITSTKTFLISKQCINQYEKERLCKIPIFSLTSGGIWPFD